MKRFQYIDENNEERYDSKAHNEYLERYGFKCDMCEKYYEFIDIESITGNDDRCDPFMVLKTTCKKCALKN
jgi:hypothetical protein